MFDIVPRRPGLYLAVGAAGLDGWLLSRLMPALASGVSPFWIDAGNSFDAYGAGYTARALGLPPSQLIARVRLARAFNLFQLETMVRVKLPPLWRGEPVVLSDPLPLFHDEDVPWDKTRAVFSRVLAGIEALPAPWLVLCPERPEPRGRGGLLAELSRRAIARATLTGGSPAHRRSMGYRNAE